MGIKKNSSFAHISRHNNCAPPSRHDVRATISSAQVVTNETSNDDTEEPETPTVKKGSNTKVFSPEEVSKFVPGCSQGGSQNGGNW